MHGKVVFSKNELNSLHVMMGSSNSNTNHNKNKNNPNQNQNQHQQTSTTKTTMTPIAKTFALGAGCYWGTEKYIVQDFQQKFPGCLASAQVGFMNPDRNGMTNPSYRQVCSGTTGHVEVLNVELTSAASKNGDLFEDMMKHFFMFHDPTTLNRQGNDAGTQYGSVIFTSDPQQTQIAEQVRQELQQLIDTKRVTSYGKKMVQTRITEYTTFYPAQPEHQQYLAKNPSGYCNHRYRFKVWPRTSNEEL